MRKLTMAEPPSLLDPFGIWRELASQLAKGLEQLAVRGVRSDAFSRAMNKALGASLVTSRVRKELLDRLLEALNLPSRSDIESLGDRLQSIEDRIFAMSAAIDRLGGAASPASPGLVLSEPTRTRKPAQDMPVAEKSERVRRGRARARP